MWPGLRPAASGPAQGHASNTQGPPGARRGRRHPLGTLRSFKEGAHPGAVAPPAVAEGTGR